MGTKAPVITPWKAPGCTLTVKVNNLSDREEASQEINEKFGGGGALNANYQAVEAVAKVANILGRKLGMKYGEEFIFKIAQFGGITFDFDTLVHMEKAQTAIEEEFI